ncbi:DUF202 domain-containing protein [Arthrobacter globiformis]|uniref:DUF202 domain-containing protein n=1 Tax=Arthrobacter globiformis TaxID=1665 RepID=UPI0027950D91|nr:DUF202 domain-containing protein [Arthrobacter globiformis]MDQ0618652.1 uncharacterized membrane protein YidH (DUF202 family) [Arthrobacter globiformis]
MPTPSSSPKHGDAGLQPERTNLAWGRTTMSMVVAATVFLRWMPHRGWLVGPLVATAVGTALAISLTRRRRFHRAIRGIQQERMTPDIASIAAVATSAVILAALGIYTVLFLPLSP